MAEDLEIEANLSDSVQVGGLEDLLSPVPSPSVANSLGEESLPTELPFRALDLIQEPPVFRRDSRVPYLQRSEPPDGPELLAQQAESEVDLFGQATESLEETFDSEANGWEHVGSERSHGEPASSVEFCEVAEREITEPEQREDISESATVPVGVWNELVASSFAQFRSPPEALLFPWETGTMAAIFEPDRNPLPSCPGFAERIVEEPASSPSALHDQLSRYSLPDHAKYVHAVRSMRDMSYFEEKSQKRDLACGQWLHILSLDWSASGIGPQLAASLQKDFTGTDAFAILTACFGVKSPSTLLKRAGAMKKYISWFENDPSCRELSCRPIPFQEAVIREYFLFLKQQRLADKSGYTIPSSFLEMVRFAKFTVDLSGTDSILGSRRLLGLSALERQAKGPSKQAPPLEIEHIKRLHEILQSAGNLVDRLGAGCFLVCTYGRARWSDLRFIDHVLVEHGENLTIFTTEHKTASVGLRREQYLPIVVPWEGVCSEAWIPTFLDVYNECGLEWDKRPLGPLLPAPRTDGSFCARPLTTSEAAAWLRGLLEGTSEAQSFKSHSLKATMLGWCARAGLDKETRAVLGHHCSALSGSEVVYSRQLQIRAIRKLSMIIRRVRSGAGFEDVAMREHGVISTPVPFTPAAAARTPMQAAPVMAEPVANLGKNEGDDAVKAAVTEAVELEELQSVKEEQLDMSMLEQAAEGISLFPIELVSAGVVEIDSSSESDSDSSSTSTESSSEHEAAPEPKRARYSETVPTGFDFFKHGKSGIVHKCVAGQNTSQCKLTMSSIYKKLERQFFTNHPKCLRCFPKDHNCIRDVKQLTDSLDRFMKKKS